MVNTKQKENGFTLIELVVVIGLIIMMTVTAIPAFSKYSKKNDFIQKADELKQIIDQARIFAQSPEKGYVRYDVSVSGDTASLEKSTSYKGTGSVVIKSVQVPKNTTITQINSKAVYICTTPAKVCCLVTTGNFQNVCDGSVPADTANGDWLRIENTGMSLARIISFKNNYATSMMP